MCGFPSDTAASSQSLLSYQLKYLYLGVFKARKNTLLPDAIKVAINTLKL